MKLGERHDIKEIELDSLTLRESDGTTWFEDVSLKIKPGESIWFKGELAASHLLKVISGLAHPTSGRVLVNGEDIHKMDFEEFLPYRMNMGYTFNLGGILNNRTIKENLLLPFLYHEVSMDLAQQEVQHILEIFDLAKYQNYRPAGVPGVFRKLCCIGRALAMRPQVLLMDDPTSSMKSFMVEGLKEWVIERRKEYPLFLLVSSDIDDLFVAERVKMISFDHMVASDLKKAVG